MLEQIVLTSCPKCEGPAQAIAAPDGPRYRHIETGRSWESTAEEPPPRNDLVLLYENAPSDTIAHSPKYTGAVIGYRGDDDGYYDRRGRVLDDVTDWMPLPAPPLSKQ